MMAQNRMPQPSRVQSPAATPVAGVDASTEVDLEIEDVAVVKDASPGKSKPGQDIAVATNRPKVSTNESSQPDQTIVAKPLPAEPALEFVNRVPIPTKKVALVVEETAEVAKVADVAREAEVAKVADVAKTADVAKVADAPTPAAPVRFRSCGELVTRNRQRERAVISLRQALPI